MSDATAARKLFIGAQVRKLRKSLELTQAQLAEGLGISASYVTLIERNQRPMTGQLILRLAEAYDIDIRNLAPATDDATLAGLSEIAADPLLTDNDVSLSDLREMAEVSPRAAEALVRLHRAYRQAREDAEALSEVVSEGTQTPVAPAHSAVEDVREALQAHDNYFDELERAAAAILEGAGVRIDLPQALTSALVRDLEQRRGVTVEIMPHEVMGGLLRRYDLHRKRLLLSELLPMPGRTFQVAQLVGHLEAGELVKGLANDRHVTSPSSRGLYRLILANYIAGAIMFPYEPFLKAAERLRYDVEILASRFGASFEQAAHRLTTLRRPGARGVPFFMLRVDRAGNISKRFGGGMFPFSRSGGTCPRWRLYEAFRNPGRVVIDLASLPDGPSFITIARTVQRPGIGAHRPGQELVVGLGAEEANAHKLIYADGLALSGRARETTVTPIGINCRVCPREACHWRAVPPVTGRLAVDINRRSLTPYQLLS